MANDETGADPRHDRSAVTRWLEPQGDGDPVCLTPTPVDSPPQHRIHQFAPEALRDRPIRDRDSILKEPIARLLKCRGG